MPSTANILTIADSEHCGQCAWIRERSEEGALPDEKRGMEARDRATAYQETQWDRIGELPENSL